MSERHPRLRSRRCHLTTDPVLAKSNKVLSLPGPQVKKWRNDLFAGKTEPLEGYAAVQKTAVERVVKR